MIRALASRRSRAVAAIVAAALGAALLLNTVDIDLAASQTATLSALPVQTDPGLDPMHSVWDGATPLEVPLSAAQGGVAGVQSATLRAVNTQDSVYVRVEWPDSTPNDRLATLTDFTDAAAVQFPAAATVSAPAICMGQANAAVNIWQWRAVLDGEGLDSWWTVNDAAVNDSNPWADAGEPDLAYPARYVGNPVSGVTGKPVLDLTAQAFGTLSPAQSQLVNGHGVWEDGRWYVVFQRDLSAPEAPDSVALAGGALTDMAVAVWDGAQGERNGQKSVSQFVKLSIPASMRGKGDVGGGDLFIAIGIPVFTLLAAGGIAAFALHTRRK